MCAHKLSLRCWCITRRYMMGRAVVYLLDLLCYAYGQSSPPSNVQCVQKSTNVYNMAWHQGGGKNFVSFFLSTRHLAPAETSSTQRAFIICRVDALEASSPSRPLNSFLRSIKAGPPPQSTVSGASALRQRSRHSMLEGGKTPASTAHRVQHYSAPCPQALA